MCLYVFYVITPQKSNRYSFGVRNESCVYVERHTRETQLKKKTKKKKSRRESTIQIQKTFKTNGLLRLSVFDVITLSILAILCGRHRHILQFRVCLIHIDRLITLNESHQFIFTHAIFVLLPRARAHTQVSHIVRTLVIFVLVKSGNVQNRKKGASIHVSNVHRQSKLYVSRMASAIYHRVQIDLCYLFVCFFFGRLVFAPFYFISWIYIFFSYHSSNNKLSTTSV